MLTDFCPATIDINVVYPKTQFIAPKTRVFIDFLLQRFKEEAYWQIN